ncbi:MAG TPA: FAD-dependent oxidoreductase [Candidatus Babeliales bacterium]|nr:FAD-dependent oxidoreductase [Candidatus Babeliales bacterium]
MSSTHVIIGAAAAGIGVVNTLRQLQPDARIICISDETELPYNKCLLADYAAGAKSHDQIFIYSAEKAAANTIHFMFGVRVTAIHASQKQIALSDGQLLSYDTLFIGTGSSPIIPAIAGIDQVQSLFTFHNLADVNKLLKHIEQHKPKSALIIGAGLSGLECADALRSRGLQVSVIEKQKQVLSSLVTAEGAELIHHAMHEQQVALHCNETVIKIESGSDNAGVTLSRGKQLSADIIVCAVGLKPNSQLALNAGIHVNNSHIVVNDYMQTSVADIYAGGDVILVKDQLTGQLVPSRTWPDAMFQGLIAAHAMAGRQKPYPGVTVITSSAFFGLKFASGGAIYSQEDMTLVTRKTNGKHNTYAFREGILKGFCLVGDTGNLASLKRALLTRQPVAEDQLI